jgi:FLVCR family feline leukemia virus subgroup C receptor-related protein
MCGVYSLIDRACVHVSVFRAEPPFPPSPAQVEQRANEDTDFVGSVKRLIRNKGYVLLMMSYGLNVGVFYAISTLLNQVVLLYFPVSGLSNSFLTF